MKRLQKDRAAQSSLDSLTYSFLYDGITQRTFERLEDIEEGSRKFARIADVGSRLRAKDLKRLQRLVNATRVDQTHFSEATVAVDKQLYSVESQQEGLDLEVNHLVADEEDLPFADGQYDLVVSTMSLHWVNDLPKALMRIRKSLKPDGVFLGSMFGGRTLQELRDAFLVADQERHAGAGLRVSPMAGIADCGNLLSRAGFALPTVDSDVLKVNYPDAFALLDELRNMGEQNAPVLSSSLKRETLLAAAAAYQALYPNPDNTIPATFEVMYMIGWAPHHTQPTPKERGSAQRSLIDELGAKPQPLL